LSPSPLSVISLTKLGLSWNREAFSESLRKGISDLQDPKISWGSNFNRSFLKMPIKWWLKAQVKHTRFPLTKS